MNNNAVNPYLGATPEDIANSTGVARFYGADNWDIMMSGILYQGGVVNVGADGTLDVPYNVGFPQRCMQVLLTSRGAPTAAAAIPGKDSFTLINGDTATSYSWVAWGT